MKMEQQKALLVGDLASARAKIIHAVLEIPSLRVEEVFLGSWSAKHLLAHLEGWDFTNLQAIQEILEGKPPSFFNQYDSDWQTYNQKLVQQYLRESLLDLIADVKASHLQLIKYLESLPTRDIVHGKVKREKGRVVTIHNLLRVEARDETLHAQQIADYFFTKSL